MNKATLLLLLVIVTFLVNFSIYIFRLRKFKIPVQTKLFFPSTEPNPIPISVHTPKTLWFLGTDLQSKAHQTHIKAAVASALQSGVSKQLYPVVLFSGPPMQIPSWLLIMNKSCLVLVLNHNLSFASRIEKYDPEKAKAFSAAFLRIDIPNALEGVRSQICGFVQVQYEYALYTDTDVLFTNDFDLDGLEKPRVILIGSESRKESMANSGVLYLNLTAVTEKLPKLLSFADSGKWDFSACDQGLILSFYEGLSAQLPDTFNWKPYWGVSKEASIIHFHGAKPGIGAECFAAHGESTDFAEECGISASSGVSRSMLKDYNIPFSQQAQAYSYYIMKYYEFQLLWNVIFIK